MGKRGSRGSQGLSPDDSGSRKVTFKLYFPHPMIEGVEFRAVKTKLGYNFVGLLLGYGGANLQTIQRKSGTKIEIHNDDGNLNGTHPQEQDSTVHARIVADSEDKLQKAVELIAEVLQPVNMPFQSLVVTANGSAHLIPARAGSGPTLVTTAEPPTEEHQLEQEFCSRADGHAAYAAPAAPGAVAALADKPVLKQADLIGERPLQSAVVAGTGKCASPSDGWLKCSARGTPPAAHGSAQRSAVCLAVGSPLQAAGLPSRENSSTTLSDSMGGGDSHHSSSMGQDEQEPGWSCWRDSTLDSIAQGLMLALPTPDAFTPGAQNIPYVNPFPQRTTPPRPSPVFSPGQSWSGGNAGAWLGGEEGGLRSAKSAHSWDGLAAAESALWRLSLDGFSATPLLDPTQGSRTSPLNHLTSSPNPHVLAVPPAMTTLDRQPGPAGTFRPQQWPQMCSADMHYHHPATVGLP